MVGCVRVAFAELQTEVSDVASVEKTDSVGLPFHDFTKYTYNTLFPAEHDNLSLRHRLCQLNHNVSDRFSHARLLPRDATLCTALCAVRCVRLSVSNSVYTSDTE